MWKFATKEHFPTKMFGEIVVGTKETHYPEEAMWEDEH
jgi:hypothetical protein